MPRAPALSQIPAYVDRKTAMHHTCLAESTFNALMARGDLPQPVKKCGKKWLWRWADIEAALSGEKEPVNDTPFFAGIKDAKTKKGRGRASGRRP